MVKACLGNYNEALIDIHKALELASGQGLAQLDLLAVKILMGKKQEVLAVLNNTEYNDSADPAYLYSLLNMPEEALYWLEKAYQERSVMLVTLKNFWFWDNLREEDGFKALYQRMNFPPSTKNKESFQTIPLNEPVSISTDLLSVKEMNVYGQRLELLANEEDVYTDPTLSLRQLADKIELHPNKLSWLLNEHIGSNFNEYINNIRLKAFKQKALDPDNSHLTLLGLAYESGFNSKTVFNSFFKKTEGITPRAWVKSQK